MALSKEQEVLLEDYLQEILPHEGESCPMVERFQEAVNSGSEERAISALRIIRESKYRVWGPVCEECERLEGVTTEYLERLQKK